MTTQSSWLKISKLSSSMSGLGLENLHTILQKREAYEEELKKLLDSYFSSVYELITEPVFIDPELKVFDEFDISNGEHEIDVVGLFRQAKPRIVFNLSEMTYVPLEGVAFICEVNGILNKQKLKHDLEKLSKINRLCYFNHEMIEGISSERYATTPPVTCLVHDQKQISEKSLENSLEEFDECWDMILIVESDELIVNSQLPVLEAILHPNTFAQQIGLQIDEASNEAVELFEKMSESNIDRIKEIGYVYMGNPLVNFITLFSLLIPCPIAVYTTNTLESLTHEYVLSES